MSEGADTKGSAALAAAYDARAACRLLQALNDSQASLEATLAAGEGWKVRLRERAGRWP